MELKFREYYQDYDQQQSGWKMPGPLGSAAGGAYLGYALSGMNPLGAIAGGVAGYGLGKLLAPKHHKIEPNPNAFTYYRDDNGKVQRYLPTAPDAGEMSPEDAERLNADPSHPYIYWHDEDGKIHSAKKGAQRYGYGQSHYKPQNNKTR